MADRRMLVAALLGLAAVVGVVVLVTRRQSGQRSGPPIPAPVNRIVSAVNGFTLEQLPASERARQLDAVRAAGVQIVRADAPWAQIEPEAPGPGGPRWRFAATDAWVAALARADLTWEPLVDYAVGWAKRCPGFCAPAGNAEYAAFARAIAARYGPRGTFWVRHPHLPYRPARRFEIWNEENTRRFWVAPARYATLYASARAAIRRVAPGATVIVGGLADDSGAFARDRDYAAFYAIRMLAADPGLHGHVDAFGLHPYGATATDVQDWVADFRGALDRLGERGAPIELTEFGWPAAQSQRATWMATLARSLPREDCGVGLLAPYDWIDPGTPGDADFGLVAGTATGTGSAPALRAAGSAWFRGLARAAGTVDTERCRR